MKKTSISILAILSFFTNIAFAGLPPTTTKSQLGTKSTTFDFQAPFNQFTKPSGTTALIETGNKNLLKDPGFESSDPTAVWVISGAGTVSRTSTSADVGSGSYALSYDAAVTNGTVTSASVVVPNGFKGKTLEASCDIKNTSAGLYKIQAYDGTNVLAEQLITTDATYYVRNTLNFPAPTSGSISIRFLSVSATEPVFYVDDCYLGLARNVGSAQLISEWAAYTLTVGATTTAPTLGTVSINSAKWRRVGDSMQIQYQLATSALGSAASGSGTYLFPVESSCTIDSSKITANSNTASNSVGQAAVYTADATKTGTGYVSAYSSTQLSIWVGTDTSAPAVVGSTHFAFGSAQVQVSFTATVPCVGWAANTVVSQEEAIDMAGSIFYVGSSSCPSGSLNADGAAISRTAYSALFSKIGTTFGSGDGSTTFNKPDLRGIFVRGTGSQTYGSETYSGSLATKQNDNFQAHTHNQSDSNGGSGGTLPSHAVVNNQAANNIATSSAGSGTETYPANIGLTPCIAYGKSSTTVVMSVSRSQLRVGRSSTQSLANGSFDVILFNSIATSSDDQASYNSGNGRYTFPKDGCYFVTVTAQFAGSSAGATRAVEIRKNGTRQSFFGTRPSAFSSSAHVTSGQDIVCGSLGDYVDATAYQDTGGSLNLAAGTDATFMTIFRLPSGSN